MATLKNIFDKCGVALYQNESLDLDHYYQEPYQDEGDEIKVIGEPFETDKSKKIRPYDLFAEDRTFSNFSFFMDGSRRTYKIGDIVIDGGKKIYPVVIAQIRAGCTERDGAKKLHSHQTILRKNLLLLSDKINTVDFKEIQQRLMRTAVAKEMFLEVVSYRFESEKHNIPVNAAIAKANSMMHDMEIEILSNMVKSGSLDTDRMLEHEDELSPIVEKYRSKTPKARYLDFNQGVDGRKINDDNMTQLARLAIKPLRIAFDDIKLKDTYCAAVRTAHRHGIKEISNYILFNYKDKPEDLYERLKINIELNRELGIQIFSFPMKYSPINRTDRSYIGVNWTKKSIRAISAILQVTKGVVAAGSDFFYKAFGNTLEEYFELLAMPRELIMFRHHFEENGTTATWKKMYQAMSDEQKKELMEFTSHTVAELKQTPCPEQFREILPYYLIKYNGKKDQMGDGAVQLSLMDDSDIVFEDQ